jgi:hypothetical protein
MDTSTRDIRNASSWDEATDGAFFRIVSSVFPAAFLYAAGVLLALNDDDPELSQIDV